MIAWRRVATWLLLLSIVVSLVPSMAVAEPLTNPDFQATWTREDAPVASHSADRAWLWGPEPFTGELQEPYGDGTRTVQYFDKARMEINDPSAERDRWFVTTGLLATELMTGEMQVSDHERVQRGPAQIPLAGDANDPDAPTYASFDRVRNAAPFSTGTTLVASIDRDGKVTVDQHFARYAVIATRYIPETDHTIANVFWNFLNQSGPVVENGQTVSGKVFDPWYYAIGLPVTEGYWSTVLVGGEPRDVLIQVFERRVLTYTPSNDAAWRVEPGNVGLHYYWWRYQRIAELPQPSGPAVWAPDLAKVEIAQGDVIVLEQPAGGGAFNLRTHSWHGGPALRDNAYRLTVDLSIQGQGEAGVGVQISGADGALAGLTMFSVSHNGQRFVTREQFDTGGTEFLLRPARISSWNSESGGWNTLAVTVHAGRAWFEVNGEIVAEVMLPNVESDAGVALVVAADGNAPVTARYRDLRMEPVLPAE